jgi:hypothetical protein
VLLPVPAEREWWGAFKPKAVVCFGQGENNDVGAVGRTIVHDDYLKVDITRREDCPKRIGDSNSFVSRGYEHGDGLRWSALSLTGLSVVAEVHDEHNCGK